MAAEGPAAAKSKPFDGRRILQLTVAPGRRGEAADLVVTGIELAPEAPVPFPIGQPPANAQVTLEGRLMDGFA